MAPWTRSAGPERVVTSYEQAGVSIDAGDRAVELMKVWVEKARRPEVLGKHVLEGIEHRAISGWTGQQAGSASVPGGAEDALTRP